MVNWFARRAQNWNNTDVQFVRIAELHTPKILRDGRMAGLVKLHRGKGDPDQGQLRAEREGRVLLLSYLSINTHGVFHTSGREVKAPGSFGENVRLQI